MHRSAELPNLVLAAIGAGTWDMDIATNTIRLSAVLADLCGFTDGVLERPLSDFLPRMHPEEVPLVMKKLQDASEFGVPYSSIHRCYRPDGTFVWLQDLGRGIEQDATGRFTRIVGAARDITAEVNTSQKLQETEAFFGDLVESVPGTILRFSVQDDLPMVLHYVSPRCAEIWEVPAENLVADVGLMRGMMNSDDAARMRAAFRNHADSNAHLDLKGHITTPSGHEKDIHFFGRPSSRTGNSVTWTVLALDITEQVRTSQKLQETEAFFADLVERIPGAILRFSVLEDGSVQHNYISPRCLEIWEMSAEDLLANADLRRTMMGPDDVLRMGAILNANKVTGANLDMKVRIKTPSGKKKELHIFGTPSSRTGEVVTWTVLALDITEQSKIEDELRKSREIILQSQKVEAIGSLTGGIAHDFNNLLAVVLGNLELLQEDRRGLRAGEYVRDAIAAALRGADLTRSLLSFARKAPLVPVTLNLNDVVRGLDSLIRRTLPENIVLETVVTGGLWQVQADRSSTESAILNLIINARDSMPTGGRITVETANIRLTEDYVEERNEAIPPGRYVMVAVTDTGCGIPPENLDRIFEPFFTTKPIGQGTGLGLSSVMGFAKQSGGTVRVYSEVGLGTSFKVYFRSSNVEDLNADSGLTDAPVPTLRRKVLLVEDDPSVRKVMKSRLEIEGCHVHEAANSDAAIQLFEAQGPFDLILTDIVMSGALQGTGLVKELRKRDPGLKAIFMSGYPNEAAIHGNGLRVEDIKLMKPVSRADLLKALSKSLA